MAVEQTPKGTDWQPARLPLDGDAISQSAWVSGPLVAVSSLVSAELPDRSGVGLQWHVSFSHSTRRPTDKDLRRALRAFGMVGAEEDNHHPGRARHFWRPVDARHRVECECKTSEETITEPDGYRWTNPRAGAGACRGCAIAPLMGRPCPVHSRAQEAR